MGKVNVPRNDLQWIAQAFDLALAGISRKQVKLQGTSGLGHGGHRWDVDSRFEGWGFLEVPLSTVAADGRPAVNARDRIGSGPWVNAKGVTVATSVADLHSANAKLGKANSLTEKGEVVTGFGDSVNRHDILTGSRPDGTVAVPEAGKDTTCGNWTRGEGGSAIVGHHDLAGTNPDPVANRSWNASHGTRGCSVPQLAQSGSAGLLYCFAAK